MVRCHLNLSILRGIKLGCVCLNIMIVGHADRLVLCTNGKRYLCKSSSGDYNHFYMFITKRTVSACGKLSSGLKTNRIVAMIS